MPNEEEKGSEVPNGVPEGQGSDANTNHLETFQETSLQIKNNMQ